MPSAVQASLRFVGGIVSIAALGMVLAVMTLKAVDSGPLIYSVPGPRPHYQDMPRTSLPAHRRPQEQRNRSIEPRSHFIDVLENQARERSAWVRRQNQGSGGK